MKYKKINLRTYILYGAAKFNHIPTNKSTLNALFKRIYNPEPMDFYNEYFEHFNPIYELSTHNYFCYFFMKWVIDEL
jgi:hypothetical protein